MNLPPDVTLGEAKRLLAAQLGGGTKCPCCTQFAKVYRRKINSSSARALIKMYRADGLNYVHAPTVASTRGDELKMVYWGLIEEERALREDGGRAGFWRVTSAGEDWLRERTTVPKYALVYDGTLVRLEGDPQTVHDALGRRFDLRELMAGI